MDTLISHSPEETTGIGEAWGREAQRGWVIGLRGDLGAGKTQLVKGIARGLGCAERVHSPTFALLNEYSGGRLPLFHIDLYRLESREEVIGAGLEDYLTNPDGVTVVEWIDRWISHSEDKPVRLASIDVTSETERRITIEERRA